ncbi:MAG: hypothetical protein KA270_18400 [Saprospiraceae bacterium]|nr:hypothetical protein [Saprospiraceae bacterium]MBP6569152.1 hypothetical protein [Saprospiraceae bacterium]
MTQSNTNFHVQNLRFPRIFSMAIFSLILISSCTQKISFLTSSVVPAARGTVKVKMDDNKNHTIQIALVNLAEPERLSPPKKMYMVWMETDQGETKNIGRIMTDSGTFSKTLKADFKTVTSFTPVKIFITAEEDANIQSPGWEVILTTAKF